MNIDGDENRDGCMQEIDRYLARGRYEQALELAEARLKACPGDVEVMIIVCQSWLGLGNLEEAKQALTNLDRLHWRLASLYKGMGDACLKRGLEREAAACFRKGMLLLPEAFEARQLSRALADVLGAGAEKIAEIEDDQEAGDRAVRPDFNTLTMADLYERQGHLEMAAEVLEAIKRREPDNAEVIRRLSYLQAMMGVLPESLSTEPRAVVVGELSRWLKNLDRIRSHDHQVGRDD